MTRAKAKRLERECLEGLKGDYPQGSLARRAVWWSLRFTEAVLKDPKLADEIPNKATVCILPDSDTELLVHNLNLCGNASNLVIVNVTGGPLEPVFTIEDVIKPSEPGAFRKARGCLKLDEPSEVLIRRLRAAWDD